MIQTHVRRPRTVRQKHIDTSRRTGTQGRGFARNIEWWRHRDLEPVQWPAMLVEQLGEVQHRFSGVLNQKYQP
ncbi:hypothetical protein BH23CHL2_BH23CHL2_27560 [soil metagenome]